MVHGINALRVDGLRRGSDLLFFKVQLSTFLFDHYLRVFLKFLVNVHTSIEREHIVVVKIRYLFKCVVLKNLRCLGLVGEKNQTVNLGP